MPMDHRPLEDWEYPEPDEEESENVAETRECPACDAEIYEEAEQCPLCGEYVVFSNRAESGWLCWIVAVALIVALLAITVI